MISCKFQGSQWQKRGGKAAVPSQPLSYKAKGKTVQRERSSRSGVVWMLSTSLSLLEAPRAELGIPTEKPNSSSSRMGNPD